MKSLVMACISGMFVFSNAHACMIPYFGPEYDALIQIKKLKDKNRYHLSLPRSVNGSKDTPEVVLRYTSHAVEEGCVEEKFEDGSQRICMPIDDKLEEINILSWGDLFAETFLSNKKAIFAGEFEAEPKDGYSISIRVTWPSQLCLTFGSATVKD